MKFQKLATSAFLQALLIGLSGYALAADVYPVIDGSYRAIVIEGTIEAGDFEKFIKIVRDNQGLLSGVTLFSPGGNFDEAMKIGRAMRALELSSQVMAEVTDTGKVVCEGGDGLPEPKNPDNCTCASACFFIHIGGVHRGGRYLVVHRPYFEKGRFGNLSEEQAKKEFDALQDRAKRYMVEMGVPKHIQDDILGTASDRALVLDEKTIKTYFWGDIPYRHEWIQNKCSQFSGTENSRLDDYADRVARAGYNTQTALSEEEIADMHALQEKQKAEDDCARPIEKQSRIKAYEKYFGVSPNDYANYRFSKWSEPVRYLGLGFDEILETEKFKEDALGNVSFLERSQTANSPSINLSDSLSMNKRVVSSVGILSSPNPSPEFTSKLVRSLEEAWGKHSGGDGSSDWQWRKDKFFAELTLEPSSAQGPYLSLKIKK